MAGARIAVAAADGVCPPQVAAAITAGGYAVRPGRFDDDPPPDAAAVLVLVDGKPEVAEAFTRRCRADSPTPRPLVWVFAADAVGAAPSGLDAGADVCLVRPVDPDVLAAQLNALRRAYEGVDRLTAQGSGALAQSERLGRLFRQADADAAFARRTLAAFAPAEPSDAVTWVHSPATRGGVNTFAVQRTADRVRFALATVGGLGPLAGAVLAEAVLRFLFSEGAGEPAAALTEANRRVRGLDLPDVAMVGVTVGEVADGRACVACGGLPPPVLVGGGGARLWHGSGPFLGQTDAGYTAITGELAAGERLLLLAGGAAADKRPDVRAAADEHAGKPLADMVQAVAGAVFTPADADDGYTLLAVGQAAQP